MFSKHNKRLLTHTRTPIYIDIQRRIREVVATPSHLPRIRRMTSRCFVVAQRVAVVDTHIRIQANNTSISSLPHRLCSKNMAQDLIRTRLQTTLHHNTSWIPMSVITIPIVSSSPNNNHLIISIRSKRQWSLEDPRAHNLIIPSIRILIPSKVTNSDNCCIFSPYYLSFCSVLLPPFYFAFICFDQSWTYFPVSVLQPQIRALVFSLVSLSCASYFPSDFPPHTTNAHASVRPHT